MDNVTFYNNIKSHLGEDGTKTHKWYGMSGAWCCMFVTKCFYEKDKSLWFGKQSYCPTAIKHCKSNLAEIPMYLAMPSDIIFFDWQPNGNPDHIGFVRGRVSTATINTIEGNTGSPSRVREKSRPAKYVIGIFRPHFKGTYNISKPLTVDGQFDYSSVAMLQKALGLKVDGILGKDTVKALQKKAGVTPDGAWGKNTSKAVQKMVGVKVDGAFGENSVKALQTWINKNVQFKTDGTKTETVKKEETPIPSVPQSSKYDGEFPDLVVHSRNYLQQVAKELAWAKGTKASKYNYKGGSPVAKFKTAINKAYPNRSGWGAKSKAGASCDVFVGTVMRYSGCDTDWKRGLDGQFGKTPKHCSVTTNIKEAQMIYYKKPSSGHTRMIVDINGTKYNCEANHDYKGGQYGHIGSKASKPSGTTMLKMFKVTSAFRAISFGDVGSEVTKLQKFLNWYGYTLTVDGEFGQITEGFVKLFQSAEKLTADGQFGTASVAKAKAVER